MSGDGARSGYWLQQRDGWRFVTHQWPGSRDDGQASMPITMDLNNSIVLEVVFASIDKNSVSLWARFERQKRVRGGLLAVMAEGLLDPDCKSGASLLGPLPDMVNGCEFHWRLRPNFYVMRN